MSWCLVEICLFVNSLSSLRRLLHLAIIHEAKDYIRTMIDLSRNTDFINRQNYQRQVGESLLGQNKDFIYLFFRYVCISPLVFLPSQTPLHLAVITNQADVCQHLLAAGCDPTLVDDGGDTPLHIACRHGNLPGFSVLTQSCRPEHLHAVMAACNYHGEGSSPTHTHTHIHP